MVTAEGVEPSGVIRVLGEVEILELQAPDDTAVNVTVQTLFVTDDVICRVLNSASVEENVLVQTQEVFDEEQVP